MKRLSNLRCNRGTVEIEIRNYMVINGNTISSRQIEVLTAIRDCGSKTAAAKALGISPPVVHKYMATMEESVGMRLMASTATGTELTEMGTGTTLAAHIAAGDPAYGVQLFLIVDRKREKVHTLSRRGRHGHVYHDHRFARANETGTVRLLRILTYVDGHFSAADFGFESLVIF